MATSLFTAKFFSDNRKYLRKQVNQSELIVVTANGLLQQSADTTYPFQQDAYFWYLTGLQDPDIVLVMDGDREYLILPNQSEYQKTFEGSFNEAILKKRSGIQQIHDYAVGWDELGKSLKKTQNVATIAPPPQYIDVYGMYTNPARWVLLRTMREHNDALELVDIRPILAKARMIKQPPEIEAIKRAIDTTTHGLQKVMQPKSYKKYIFEYEVMADLTQVFQSEGSDHAFEPIIAGGKRACILHNTGNRGKVNSKELLLFDVGASHEGYAADISRTIALSEPTARQQDIYTAVIAVQDYALSLLKPGVYIKEYETAIEQYMGEQLIKLGLIKKNTHEEVRKYYPHATSHHLGLDVHDVADHTLPLAPNMVITVEPGIYIPEEGIGIRIEDDVQITEAGAKNLSQNLPARLR